MHKRKIRMLWLVLVGMALLLGAVYVLLPRITAGIAEHSLKKTLTEYGFADSVTWDSVRSTRWADTLEVRDLQIRDATFAPVELRIDHVAVSDYTADFAQADIMLDAIQPLHDDNAFGRFYYDDLLQPITAVLGVSRLPPQHVHLAWRYDQARETWHATVQLNVPTAGRLGVALSLHQPPSLQALQAELMHPQVWLKGRAGIQAKLLEILWRMPLEKLQLDYDDDGYFKHLAQAHQADSDTSDACRQQLQALPENQRICRQLMAVYHGERSQLSVAMASHQPIAVGQLVSALAGNPQAAASLAQLDIDVH